MDHICGNSVQMHLINVAISLLHLPNNSHTCLLGLLINQTHIRDQSYHPNCILVLKANNSHNGIVRTCKHATMYNSNTCIRYKYFTCLSNTTCINYPRNNNYQES